MSSKRKDEELEPVMGRDPFSDDDEILASTFYGAPAGTAERAPQAAPAPAPRKKAKRESSGRRTARGRRKKSQPSHYRIVSISLYNEDIEKIDNLVAELKKMGHTKANRSALIRYAIDTVDINKMPKAY